MTNAGALVPQPGSNPATVTVPQFIAAALRPGVAREQVHRASRGISDRLLRQEALGIPLSERDTLFCARTLEATGIGHEPTPEQRAVLLRTVANYIAFGMHAKARSLLLSFSSIGQQLGPLTHARMLAALGNLHAAIEALASPDLRTDAPTLVAARFLHTTLLAEIHGEQGLDDAGSSSNRGLADEEPCSSFDSTHSDALLTFRLWNSRGSLTSHLPQLQRIANTHADRRVAHLAGALLDLEAIWHGKLPPLASWLRSGRRVPIIHGASELDRDLASTLLGAHALMLLMTGESLAREDELYEAAQALPVPSVHDRWLGHLLAAGFAVTYGDTQRALVEWELLRTHTPRFFPLRLRQYFETISKALSASASESSPAPDIAESLAYRYALFFTGKHRALQQARRDPATDGDTLPLIRLANDQLNASQFRNPVALQRVADRFTDYEMWLPAAYALIEARRIYISRRATGRVLECDQALERVWREALAHAPWFTGQRDVLQTPEQLTPRELETAQLAAVGKSNRQIAEQLGCKVRTVESHLAQARAKLGASSRQEIAEILSRLRL